MKRSEQVLLAIVGPTASGKTHLGMLLAGRLNGEIVSADSRQVYRHLDIGTAKPTPEDLRNVRHHFIDILDPPEDYNAGIYSDQARRCVEELFGKSIQPILVGGTGLYAQGVIDGFFDGPGKDDAIRRQLEEEAAEEGAEKLFLRLMQVDPVTASKLDPTKLRRIIRALEVYTKTGKTLSDHHAGQNSKPVYGVMQIGLKWERKVLYERINRRVDFMLEKGLVEEAERLLKRGVPRTVNALNTVGYKEVFNFLDGIIDKNMMIELIKRNSRRFAKRQMTWFRADERIHWMQVDAAENWEALTDEIVDLFRNQKKRAENSN
jgi:tRNA dimethylallyltransferase